MKSTSFLFVSLLGFLALAALPAKAQYTYTTNNGAITITGYNAGDVKITIPSTLHGLPVTTIGDYAFFNTRLTSVTIPDSVKSIGDYAFANAGLTSVTIGNSVTNIGDYAFFQCAQLTNNLTIPDSVTSIGDYAFGEACLTSVTIGNGITSIGDYAFEGTCLTSVTIPDSITVIGDSAFSGAGLASVTIGNSVTSIGPNAFSWTPLTSVTIPNSVTNICNGAFWGCDDLTQVTISGVTAIGYGAFGECYNLTNVFFESNAPTVIEAENFVEYSGGGTIIVIRTLYYLPGTTGWDSIAGWYPTAPWTLPYPLILSSSLRSGSPADSFGFLVSWATNLDVVVEAATNLSAPAWQPLQTNALAGGLFSFSDRGWTNYPGRFYRVRSW